MSAAAPGWNTPLRKIAPHARLTFADSDIRHYDHVPCPACGYELAWAVQTPPIPLTLYRWFDDEKPVSECPRCDEWLPEGNLLDPDRSLA